MEAALADDATLATELAGLRQHDPTLQFLHDHLARVAALNSRELLIAARRHIDPARLIKVLAGSWPALLSAACGSLPRPRRDSSGPKDRRCS